MNQWNSPAKLNLYLAITGIRESDGFHELDSLVTLLDFGDTISIGESVDGEDYFESSDAGLLWNDHNLMYRAAKLYRSRTGWERPVSILLDKRIPMGAGLGGGSSNASILLKALNAMNPMAVDTDTLKQWSAELGSDCPLFFSKGLIRMRGRGERVHQVQSPSLLALQNKKILLMHPGFGIAAAWAYRKLKEHFPLGYTSQDQAAAEIRDWLAQSEPWGDLHRNDLSPVVDRKFLAIPVLRHELFERFGIQLWMSGSGSACYCILDQDFCSVGVVDVVRRCWGERCFIQECHVLDQ